MHGGGGGGGAGFGGGGSGEDKDPWEVSEGGISYFLVFWLCKYSYVPSLDIIFLKTWHDFHDDD